MGAEQSTTDDASNSSSSSFTRAKNGPEVTLNVYTAEQQGFQMPGFGVYHSGIEINGMEYTFAGSPEATGSGIQAQKPKVTPPGSQWIYNQSVNLGKTDLSSSEISALLSSLRADFPANQYDLVTCNCNHFTELVTHKLHLDYPSWVNRAAKVGNLIKGGQDPLAKDKAKQMEIQKQKKQQEHKRAEAKRVQQVLQGKQAQLKAEPAVGPEVCTLQLNLPNGTKQRRRFHKSSQLAEVVRFAKAYDLSLEKASKIELRSNFPTKTYADLQTTLTSNGFGKTENLFLMVRS
jgi:hypothetical protein